jgi:hypothetical protein
MRKLAHLPSTIHPDGSGSSASGAIGPVEAVFWAPRARSQWRFRGDAFVVGPDIEARGGGGGRGGEDESRGAQLVRRSIGSRVRAVRPEGAAGWSWWREVQAHFDNLSPIMRGSFKNPLPGSPVLRVPPDGLAVGQTVMCGLDGDLVARANFRVVVICPDEVEQLDLAEMDRARRWRYTFGGGSAVAAEGEGEGEGGEVIGEWRKEELWP